MTQKQNNYNLLKVLQAHYNQIVNLIASLRLKSYRPDAKSPSSKKLAAQLRDYINHFPVSNQESPATDVQDDSQSKVNDMKTAQLEKQSPTTAQPDSDHPVFSNHHPVDSVGEKLMQSTWDHLHASIRYARAGNTESAKLHASIMDSALKEAAHFLEKEVYNDFVLNLGKEMNKLVFANEPNSTQGIGSREIH